MTITYEVYEHHENSALIKITPANPINGFHGAEIWVIDAPIEGFDEWVKARVEWKVRQEVGAVEKDQLDFVKA